MELPLYILDIDESQDDPTCVFAVGLVEQPAIERNWMAFAAQSQEENKPLHFEVTNEEQRILGGYLMVADQPIFRRDPDGKQYYVAFNSNSITKIVNKYAKHGKPLSFNYDHKDANKVNSAYLLYHYQINSKLGLKAPEGFEDAPDGSWFGFIKVADENEWEEAKKRKGFSVEGYFTDTKILDAEQSELEDLKDKLINNNMNKQNVEKKLGTSLFSKLKNLFEDEKPEEVIKEEMGEALADGSAKIKGTIAEGETITLVMADGSEVPAPDGEHALESGKVIMTEGSVIKSVTEKEAEEMPMSEQDIMSAINNATEKVSEELKKEFSAKQTALEKELKEEKEKVATLFEAVLVLSSTDEDTTEKKEDPKRKSDIFKKSKFSQVTAIINKLPK